MKKLIAVIVMLIFLLPFSTVEAGKSDKRYKKNSKEYSRNYDRHNWGHDRHDWGHHRGWYKHHRHDRHSRDYRYKRHYSKREWERHYRRNRDRYRDGGYHRDRDSRLMFSYCQEDSSMHSSKEVCFSVSIGN